VAQQVRRHGRLDGVPAQGGADENRRLKKMYAEAQLCADLLKEALVGSTGRFMCKGPECLGYLLLAVLIGFTGLIFLLLTYRKKILKQSLKVTADEIWSGLSSVDKTAFKRSDLLFGISQDQSAWVSMLLVKNDRDETVGRVEFPTGARRYRIWIKEELFNIDFQLTWNRSAVLSADNDHSPLASYERYGAFGRRRFKIPGYGEILSARRKIGLRNIFDYHLDGKLMGTSQKLSASREIGSLILLPSDLPLHIRIFLLVL